jgi:hypothetical protein
MDKTDEALQELYSGVDQFAEAMKRRLKEKHEQGYRGWSEFSQEHLEYRIKESSSEIPLNPIKSIDTANLCAMHYLNRRK